MIKTTSLGLSKQMKELGIEQNSQFYWVITSTTNYHLSYTGGDKSLLPQERNDYYSAFLTEEVLEQLPIQLKNKDFFSIQKFNTYWVGYGVNTNRYIHFDSEILAEAAGKCWIYLKEQGLLKGKV